MAALKLLNRVKEINYIVLERLAERTLAEQYQAMASGGYGYDSNISEWMSLLLPLAVERGTCIIINMGAMDPLGAREKVLEIASSLGICLSVAVAHETFVIEPVMKFNEECELLSFILFNFLQGISTYLRAAPIVACLERYQPNVIITSRVADAALFLAPMVYELGWNWDDLELLAQGSVAGYLLECGCQLTGGYFMHPADKHWNLSFTNLLDLSLPYAEILFSGEVCVIKAEEVGDPSAYITPEVPLSSSKVLCSGAKPSAHPIPDKLLQLIPKHCGWKGWSEISYGGYECVKRAKAAEFLASLMLDHGWKTFPGVISHILSYIIGLDSLKAISIDYYISTWRASEDIRLRMDGLFQEKKHAQQLVKEFTALYTDGPAGGGGISTGVKKEIVLEKQLLQRPSMRQKGVNEDDVKVEIYEVQGIQSLNVVVRIILDGGVNCSRRIDRHGKCISDLILCQHVVLPP
ncbi:disease resistance protein RPP13 [Hibiscus syriacus]|uniref:Disease resistance protein RPP13 n=1 Tax=Hibiscus syriacus TaxID=106335 RepID=A0A6A2XKD6_HIBSY|nr:disease resistance protein RPP13 [Hibiscus syriacus]